MPTTLDWKLREALPHLRENGRLNVLVALILRANVRNRCWPTMERIAKDTGYGLEAVNEAKKWLKEHGAIEIVPFAQRVGEEKKIRSNRQHVYQLTGVIEIDGTTYPYFYISPTEISDSEISPTESEVVTSLKKGKQTKEQVVVVSAAAAESTDVPLKAELPQPKPLDELREGKDDEQPLKGLSHPVPQHPLSQTGESLLTALSKADVSRTLGVELIEAYGEGRVSAVWSYALKHRATIHSPVAFLRSELANPRYVPLNAAAPDETPAEEYTEIDEAEIETQTDAAPVVDASVFTLVDGKDTAAAKWSLVANQLALKGSRAIRDAQLVAYDALTQTYTVQVARVDEQKQLSGRNARVVASTLTGLHAGSSVTFIVRQSIKQGI